MNKLSMFLTVRSRTNAASKHAIESFLMELTAKTDITAVYSEHSLGQFVYYNLTTDLNDGEVSRIAHQVLNDYHSDDNKRIRRYLIIRCYVCNYVE